MPKIENNFVEKKKELKKLSKRTLFFVKSGHEVIKKLSKNCQKLSKVVKKLSKSCQKVVKKLAKSCKKLAKSWQKVCKKFVKIRPEHLLKILERSEEEEEGEGDL
jgi:uncharacterized membrane-anchored protein YhcB (DUF1043 family)